MAIRQEQVVLIGAVALLGFLFFSGPGGATRESNRKKPAPEFEHHRAPDVGIATPRTRSADDLERELFAPPRDTRPLPMLAFVSPQLEPLQLLRPLPAAGPEPARFGQFLRVDKAVEEAPGLFLEAEVDEGAAEAGEEFAVSEDLDESLMTVEERQARLAAYKAKYDWVNIGGLHFGHIENEDRYSLFQSLDEPVKFVEVNPATGLAKFPNQEPFVFERDERLKEFAFADTVENDIELRRLEFTGALTQGQYLAGMELATHCVLNRFETPRALEVAAELYEKLAQLSADDPTAVLGLAFCAEAAFDFEEAFGIYHGLLDGNHGNHPLVLTRLAQLEARFRLTHQAEEHFRQAESFGRTSWLVQWEYGKFLLARGDVAEAHEHLKLAHKFEPTAADFQSIRAAIRTDLADSLVGLGELTEAQRLYTSALQADENEQRATAGLLNVAYLSGEVPPADDSAADTPETEGAGFELLLSQGLAALNAGDHVLARERLVQAAESDPLRAYQAWRALSHLAEVTGNGAEALDYIDRAEANDPTDVYTLFQRGRILAQNDDVEGAKTALTKALDRELELPDALAALGRLEMQTGDNEAAERYLERSVGIDGRLASAHTLRGLNALQMDRPEVARDHFDQALALDGTDPVANLGRGWCEYALGDPTEAKTLLREFEDSRRSLSEEDVYRVYANEQIANIDDWQEKVAWTDRFERQDLRNGWTTDEIASTRIDMVEGHVLLGGNFDKVGRTRLKRFFTSGDFVSLEAKLTVRADNTVRVGLFVALEQRRGARAGNQTSAEVTLSRHPQEKVVQYRSMRRGREDDPYIDSDVMPWADGQPVTLRLERYGESAKTAFRVLVDGVPIAERVPMPALGATTREIVVGIFAEGESGRRVNLEVDDVEIVKRER